RAGWPFGSAVVDGCCLSSPLRNIVIALPLECEIVSAVQIVHPLRQAARPTVLATQPVSAEAGKDYRSRPKDRGKQTVAGVAAPRGLIGTNQRPTSTASISPAVWRSTPSRVASSTFGPKFPQRFLLEAIASGP